ncbi:hypothetical protein PAA26_02740 [Methanomassiliicoccaceae archaeon COG_1]|nr:hypothetical protein [Methanomassiliicoccaceae archaeon COG_1]
MVPFPVIHYQADEIHLFHHIRNPGAPKAQLYEDHCKETCRQISDALPNCRIIEHPDTVIYDFSSMARILGKLYAKMLDEHPDAPVYANFSSGPDEFTVSLGIFFIPESRCETTPEHRLPYYNENGKPVPSAKRDRDDEILVRLLRIYDDILQGGRPPVPEMQNALEGGCGRSGNVRRRDARQGRLLPRLFGRVEDARLN